MSPRQTFSIGKVKSQPQEIPQTGVKPKTLIHRAPGTIHGYAAHKTDDEG